MHKSFLQQVGESLPGFMYGWDIYDLLSREQVVEEREPNKEWDLAHSEWNAVKEKNKLR